MKNYSDSIKTYPESKISVKMLDFFFDNIHSSQLVSIPMGTNIYACTPILLPYSYEMDFIHGLFARRKKKKLAQSVNFGFRYIDDAIFKKINSDHSFWIEASLPMK
jgi:hypothetical protein